MTETTSTTGLVQQFIERTERLYSLPAVAMEVLRLTAEPRVDARALKDCIELDPALTTRILRVVNSSLFAASRQVTDLNQALSILGMRPLKMLVLGFSLPKELFSDVEAEVLARYWRRTLTKAAAARELAQRLWHVPGDEAFTAGLVQDIGVLALIQQLGRTYVEFLSHIQTHGGSLLTRELETLGFDHGILSARLLAHWGLPAPLCAAVAIPPDETRIAELAPAERTLPEILHLAELVAQLVDQPYGPALRDLLEIGGRYRGLTYESLRPIVSAVQQQVAELAAVLALELPAGQSFADLLIAAQARMADETLSAAAQSPADPEGDLLQVATRLRSELAAAAGRTATAAHPAPPRTAAQPAPSRPLGRGERSAAPTSRSAPAIDAAADLALEGLVAGAVNRCRQMRCSVSLALVSIDRFGDLLLRLGPDQATDLVHGLRFELADWTGQRSPATTVGEACFALVWEDCSRSEALQLARQVLSNAKEWRYNQPGSPSELTLSAGLATLEVPPRNYDPAQLISAAQRCLSGAQLSGGDTLKSIAF
jgi:HD-like signal output (HDOD) protein